ncbi:hypothetical protein [Legionella spiritensis]|uniref:hypothetical protein n=1 Tax=Legionella spiritensis TaxID=452 RepID=UPI000F6E7E83|nr:hypothetical protein [Legionella spiritensis]VEG89667.1 Uncharacterised protein [Legionella spiritensis]
MKIIHIFNRFRYYFIEVVFFRTFSGLKNFLKNIFQYRLKVICNGSSISFLLTTTPIDKVLIIDEERLKLNSQIPIEVLRVIPYLTIDKALLAKHISLEQLKLVLGIGIEQLRISQKLDYIQLKQAQLYFKSLDVNKSSPKPQSLLEINCSDFVESNPIKKSLKILLLADDKHEADVVKDYISAFPLYSYHEITVWNPCNTKLQDCLFTIETYDVVILHYSICVLYEHFLPAYLVEKISDYKGLKVMIIQDECRWINRMVNRIEYLGVDILISSMSVTNISKVYYQYGIYNVLKFHSLPGYVSENFLNHVTISMDKRERHVAYRGRQLSYQYGRQAQEKSDIALQFNAISKQAGLTVDLDAHETQRLYGKDWINFIKTSKAVLAVEGGVSIYDFDELVNFEVEKYLTIKPDATFEEVARSVLQPYEGNVVHRTVTPRIFEAICLRTALILYPGNYSNILKPWEHYIPLERDGSNADKVIALLKDDNYLTELTDRTYQDIALNPEFHFRTFIKKMDVIIAKTYKERIRH